jgi:hypothetical protein
MESNEITLQTICHGGVPEIFERELRDVLANIADPNTHPEKVRTITLKFAFKPQEDRSGAVIDFSCKAALQPVKTVKSQMFLSRHTGALRAYAQDARQVALFDPPTESKPMAVVK